MSTVSISKTVLFQAIQCSITSVYWNLTIRWISVIIRTLVGGGGFTPLQRCRQCILQLQSTGQKGETVNNIYQGTSLILTVAAGFVIIFRSTLDVLWTYFQPVSSQHATPVPKESGFLSLINLHSPKHTTMPSTFC